MRKYLIPLFFAATCFTAPYTVIKDTSNLPLLNPNLKERKTLKIKLNNGLEALLISDPGADQSAAALAVKVGSWNDPAEYPGMAHFCEHMLFMGTEKYPNENEFFSQVANYAGSTNAFTAPDHTVYMFASQVDGFLQTLDRFAHFFIDPLFNPSGIAREMHAVDQEAAKNVENDGWREYMVFKETGNPDHPNKGFSCGNSETLGKIPPGALKEWHASHYSSDKMMLVIYSSLPLATLKEATVQLFHAAPKNETVHIDVSASVLSEEQKGSITYIKPVQDRQTLNLSWELPKDLAVDSSKSAETLAYALRRGQKNSLYEKLKADLQIDSISTKIDDVGTPEHRLFQISIELTQKGIQEVDTVMMRCFEAIALMQQEGVPEYLFLERNTMAALNYQYQERQDPFDYITKLADSIVEEDLSSFPRNLIIATEYDGEKIKQAAKLLIPRTCMVTLLASPELTKVFPDRKEKWYGAEYAVRQIAEKKIKYWSKAGLNADILMAEPNPFIPTNLALKPAANETPELIADSDLGKAYYVRSAEFQTPDSDYHLHILSPELNPTPRAAVLASLYVDHLTDLLHPTLAAASSAGLKCQIAPVGTSIQVNIAGFSEKAPLLLQEIIRAMPETPPTPEQFAIYTSRHEKAYNNGQKELAARQAKELLDSVLNQEKSTKKTKLAALKEITYEEFLEFHKNLFETTYCQALFAGNLTLKEAESAWLDIVHFLGKAPFPKEEHFSTKVMQLPAGSGPWYVTELTEARGNAALLLIDEGNFTYQKRAVQEMLAGVAQEAFFTELRTKQKTGYIAQSQGIELEERLFHFFIVQSNSHGTEDLLFRFEQFLEAFNDRLSENVDLTRFETLKTSHIDSLKNRFRNLRDKSALWDQLAFERDGNFSFVENRIKALEELTHEQFLSTAKSFLHRTNRKRLAILFDGKLSTPFLYESIALPRLEEISSYEPRSRNLPN